jgi:hypothetical protein
MSVAREFSDAAPQEIARPFALGYAEFKTCRHNKENKPMNPLLHSPNCLSLVPQNE